MIFRSLLFSLLFSSTAFANYNFEVKVNGSDKLQAIANELTTFKMSFTHQKTGMKPHHYMKMHDKLMHMIVVSDDLEHFAHIHPSFHHHMKNFTMHVNVNEAPDPDNLDSVNTLPFGGRYFAFTEVMPHDDDMMMVYSRFALDVKGDKPAKRKPSRSISKPGEKLVKFFDHDGREAAFGAKYRATMDFEQHQWCSWYLPKFYVLIETWDSENKSYKAAEGLQKWLGMGGHSILISRNQVLADVHFYHLHALLPITIPGEFVFPYHDHQKGMSDGNYRMFMQFKHDNKVQKIKFDFEYENPTVPEISRKAC